MSTTQLPHGRVRNLSELYLRAYWRLYGVAALWVLVAVPLLLSMLGLHVF